ncbi:hypothetical protein [Streptomyces sp. OE57]|uniref:hypothetical protein n=1 Tax=Streptomyces lacaronensis TaxID=3379885 RepID=UPI0039B72616
MSDRLRGDRSRHPPRHARPQALRRGSHRRRGAAHRGNTLLFESIVNLVHTALPQARFIFNHSAAATPDDIRRHYPDPASAVPLDIPRDLEETAVKNPGNAARPEAAHGPRETR